MPRAITLSENIRPILGSLRSVPVPAKYGEAAAPRAVLPFVTLSRETGAGAWTLAQALAEALNTADPCARRAPAGAEAGAEAGEQRWTCWDRELVEKIAADHHLSKRLIDSLETTPHSWFTDFLSSLSFADVSGATIDAAAVVDELRVFRTVASSIRALAAAGKVIIVGRGGVFLTRQLPGGIHVRLVAPLEKRIENMAAHLSIPRDAAAAKVRELTRLRDAFYHRFFPGETIRPELFTVTLNTAAMSQAAAIEIIAQLARDAAAPP